MEIQSHQRSHGTLKKITSKTKAQTMITKDLPKQRHSSPFLDKDLRKTKPPRQGPTMTKAFQNNDLPKLITHLAAQRKMVLCEIWPTAAAWARLHTYTKTTHNLQTAPLEHHATTTRRGQQPSRTPDPPSHSKRPGCHNFCTNTVAGNTEKLQRTFTILGQSWAKTRSRCHTIPPT